MNCQIKKFKIDRLLKMKKSKFTLKVEPINHMVFFITTSLINNIQKEQMEKPKIDNQECIFQANLN